MAEKIVRPILTYADEAHRLHRRAHLSQYPAYDRVNKELGLDNDSTELDWIIKCSRMQLIFYDENQSVRPSDIDRAKFLNMIGEHSCKDFKLESQLRCKGGNDYIEYVKDVLNETAVRRHNGFADYEIRMFDNPNEMINEIKHRNDEITLCRVVAGYGWKWISKDDKNAYDIVFDNVGYKWNTTATDWINSSNSVNEIGCIHTVQGYDLNYAGVIFGPEIRYDNELNTIVIDKSNYYDSLGKTQNMDEMKNFIINIYVTLMTRGIRGTYIYACDKGLQEYLRKFF